MRIGNGNGGKMKTVGKRQEPEIFPEVSAGQLKRAAMYNETLQSTMPNGSRGYIPKGVYHFHSHSEANRHQDECLANHLACIARERSK